MSGTGEMKNMSHGATHLYVVPQARSGEWVDLTVVGSDWILGVSLSKMGVVDEAKFEEQKMLLPFFCSLIDNSVLFLLLTPKL
jgi:hypothetical protein